MITCRAKFTLNGLETVHPRRMVYFLEWNIVFFFLRCVRRRQDHSILGQKVRKIGGGGGERHRADMPDSLSVKT